MHISKNLIGLAAVGILVAGCSSSTDDSARPAGSTGSADSASGDKAKAPEPKADLAVPVTGPQPDVSPPAPTRSSRSRPSRTTAPPSTSGSSTSSRKTCSGA